MNDFDLKSIPNEPGIYAMYDKGGVAYVGQGGKLRNRIKQHLIRHDSSATIVPAPVRLNPDKVRQVHFWWNHESFSDKNKREAAEFVAFKVLKPSLHSRGKVSKNAQNILKDQQFCNDMARLFSGDSDGIYRPTTLDNLADMVFKLHKRVSELEEQLKKKGN